MPRADEPRVQVRFGADEHEKVEAWAHGCGVAKAAFIRECAVRFGPELLAAVAEGRVVLRAENGTPRRVARAKARRAEAVKDRRELGADRAVAFRRATGGGK